MNSEKLFTKEQAENKQEILEIVRKEILGCPQIEMARAYGSWLFQEDSYDLDVAVMLGDVKGVAPPEFYDILRDLRVKIKDSTQQDIDLVPHTHDEIDDLRSPLFHPRYNPSLVTGYDFKGTFPVRPSFNLDVSFTFADIAAYTMYDTRTICRRQLVRSLNKEEARVFVSKLLHGPGNALTYYACDHGESYLESPSNREKSFEQCDNIFGLDSEPAQAFLTSCQNENLDFESAKKLMGWYERLVSAVLNDGDASEPYNQYCKQLSQ